jgi:hypothetical protein
MGEDEMGKNRDLNAGRQAGRAARAAGKSSGSNPHDDFIGNLFGSNRPERQEAWKEGWSHKNRELKEGKRRR